MTQTPAIAAPWTALPKDPGDGGSDPDPDKETGRTETPEDKKKE